MSFRKAIASGRRSGGGRVVMTLYDECYEVWGGSPVVESVPEGLESSTDSECSGGSLSSHLVEDASAEQNSLGKETSEMEGDVDFGTKDIGERRKELLQFIKEKKDSRFMKRHSVDTQLLDIAKEEVALKKEPLT